MALQVQEEQRQMTIWNASLGLRLRLLGTWKGAELPAINSNGSIPSVVSANPAAGFSIVSLQRQMEVDTSTI